MQNEWCALIAQPGVVVAAFPAWVVMLSTPNAGSDVEHIPRHSGSAGIRTLKVVDDRTAAARALTVPSSQLCVMLGLVLVAALLSSWPSLGERNQGVCSSGQAELWFDGAVAIRRGYGFAKGGDVVLHVVGTVHLEAPTPHDRSVQLHARTFNASGAPLCPMWLTAAAAPHQYFFKLRELQYLHEEFNIHQLLYQQWQEPLPSSAPAWLRQRQPQGPQPTASPSRLWLCY